MSKTIYNHNFDKLERDYLFSEIRKRKLEYEKKYPDKKIINLGVGDVIGGLCENTINAMKNAAVEYASEKTFKGYPPESGYPFLKQKIADYYAKRGVKLNSDEIFVSDGAKSDLGNILDIFDNCVALIPNPVYPVYVDSNVIRGNAIEYVDATPENSFLPTPEALPSKRYLIYICSPSNPTGATYDEQKLRQWIDFAVRSDSIIIYDSAYEAYIKTDKPHSIFELNGSDECSIEIGSFSKRAGFTGLRLGYTVIKRNNERMKKIAQAWSRRQATKFNGVSYLIQKAGESTLTDEGIREYQAKIDYYLDNAEKIKSSFQNLGYEVWGGIDSPYVWIDCKKDSWEFFDELLYKYQIVGTAGAGFGRCGKGFFRLSSFATKSDVDELTLRLST